MTPLKKKILHAIAIAFIVLLVCLGLKNSYEKELNTAFNRMIPSISNRNFTFFSGDKDVTRNINFPTTISLELRPGDRFFGTFVAKNHESYRKTFNLSADMFKNVNTVKNGGVVPEFKFLHTREFDLLGEAMEIIEYAIDIPKNTKEGQYNSVASLILYKSDADENDSGLIKLQPAIGISIKINVSGSPKYHEYAALITGKPYEIAKKKTIVRTIQIITVLFATISILLLHKHFRRKQ